MTNEEILWRVGHFGQFELTEAVQALIRTLDERSTSAKDAQSRYDVLEAELAAARAALTAPVEVAKG
jgi:hypothetical protein